MIRRRLRRIPLSVFVAPTVGLGFVAVACIQEALADSAHREDARPSVTQEAPSMVQPGNIAK